MKRGKLLAVAVLVLAILVMIPFVASAQEPSKDGWYSDKGYYEYFEDGNQYKDGEYWISEYDAYFRFDANGKMYNKEWYKNPETLDWYYYQAGGYRADNCVIKIGDNYYGFDYNGVMYTNGDFGIYSEEKDMWFNYTATSGGSLVTNKWVWTDNSDYAEGGYWKYYGADGAVYTGVQKIGNNYYFFHQDGTMLNNQEASVYNYEIEDWEFVRAKKGGALYCKEWYKNEYGSWYYYTDRAVAATGLTKVGSTTYYFAGDGWMLEDTTYYDEYEGYTYYADQHGSAIRLNPNSWTLIGKDYYYCVDGQRLFHQIKQIGSAAYYFDYSGKMLDNDYDYVNFYDESSDTYQEGYIRAKKGGALYCGGWYLNEDGNYEYYGYDFFKVEDGLKTIGSNLYYFEYGYAVKNQILELEDGVYVADSTCALTNRSYGWINLEGVFYYVKDNQLVRDSMLKIGDDKFIFDESGRMYANGIYYAEDEEGYYNDYLLAENGAVIAKKGWTAFYGNWYYVTEGGALYTGELELNGKTYYLYPSMNYGDLDYIYDEDGIYLYLVNPDGTYQKVTKDGSYNTLYGRMLVENGKLFTGWKNVGGKFYYYDPEMCVNGIRDIYENEGSSVYYFDNQGVMKANGWISYGNSYLYADAYGRLTNGVKTISNKTYLFDGYELCYDSYAYVGDSIYVSDSNAFATLLPSGDGWKQANGYWYYVIDGNISIGYTYVEENDTKNCYYFDTSTGRMLSDGYRENYYFDIYGRRFEGWKAIDGAWYYFGPSMFNQGDYYIDGERYCFDQNGKMISNTTYYSWTYDKMFVIDAYGKVVDEYDVPDGIVYDNGEAYMYKNGQVYDGWYGDNYFDYGRMVINEIITVNEKHYYIDKHGKYIRNGWCLLDYGYSDGEWMYADAYGTLYYDEWLKLGNAWYYFSGPYMLSDGVHYIDTEDKWGNFDKYGKFIGYVAEPDDDLPKGTANSWKKIDGKWYYYNSTGSMVSDCTLYLNGFWYQFDYSGAMVSNRFCYDHYGYYGNIYYYTASGARLEAPNQWKMINGNWCYFNADSSVANGWVDVSGKRYFVDIFEEYDQATDDYIFCNEMYTGYRLIGNTVYSFANNGVCNGKYTGNGWLRLADGDYVYFKNGKLLSDGIYTINGVDYYFNHNGRLYTNTVVWIGSGRYYYASASGAIYGAGWHQTDNGWIYVDASGYLLTHGVYKIGSGIYFFDGYYWVA